MSGAELSVARIAEYRRYVDELFREIHSSATPRAVLSAGRAAAEVMCKHCYERHVGPAGKMMLDELATKLHQKNLVPARAATAIRTVQAFGNLGAHPQADLISPSSDDVATMRAALKIVRAWYDRDVAPSLERPVEKRARRWLWLSSGAAALAAAGVVAVAWLRRDHAEARATTPSSTNMRASLRDASVRDTTPPPRPEMVRIVGATFEMGSTPPEMAAGVAMCREVERLSPSACAKEQEIIAREEPRRVTVSTFDLDRDEVTRNAFTAWARGAGVTVPSLVETTGSDDAPAAGVTWELARRYCKQQGKRLPTEAEWELAARGTERRTFPWGDATPACADVVFARDAGRVCDGVQPRGPAATGSAPRDVSRDGVRDLGGNVSEWTADAALARPTCEGPCLDPRIDAAPDAAPSTKRVLRGGNWRGRLSWLRAAGRSELPGDTSAANVGFRCAASLAGGG